MPIETTNQFGLPAKQTVQNQSTTSKTTSQSQIITQPKQNWVPPIIIDTQIGDYKKCIEKIRVIIGHNNFTVQFNHNRVKLLLRTDKDHALVVQELKKLEIESLSYTKQERKDKKNCTKSNTKHSDQ